MKKKIAILIAFLVTLLALYLFINMSKSSNEVVSHEKVKNNQRFCPNGRKGICTSPE